MGLPVSPRIPRYHLLPSGEGDVDTAHRLLVGAIETQHEPYDTTMIEALHTLTRVCHGAPRPELWNPLEKAVGLLQPEVPDQLALSVAMVADQARTAPPALARLDEAITILTRRRTRYGSSGSRWRPCTSTAWRDTERRWGACSATDVTPMPSHWNSRAWSS
ncbi:hypothetical protein [Streptomyces violascens]|uniref:hypothetical protein n=1 Tax=Streptomyces violascens TaxID=67381 RepID=UPI0036A8F783